MTLWETRKINERNLNDLKIKLHQQNINRTQEFRQLKLQIKEEVRKEEDFFLEERREEVRQQLEI
jgi:hypothetical protein